MSFSSGKHALFISDRSGMAFPYKERIKEWNGAVVHISEYEPKHPQLEPTRHIADAQALKQARPDRTEPSVEILLKPNSFLSSSSGSAVITVLEPSHGRTTGNTVRFRKVTGFDGFSEVVLEKTDGYTITVVDSGSYTFTASSGTATTGNTFGGGANATVGPVTLES